MGRINDLYILTTESGGHTLTVTVLVVSLFSDVNLVILKRQRWYNFPQIGRG